MRAWLGATGYLLRYAVREENQDATGNLDCFLGSLVATRGGLAASNKCAFKMIFDETFHGSFVFISKRRNEQLHAAERNKAHDYTNYACFGRAQEP